MQAPTFQSAKKVTPFGAHLASKIDEANSKVVCQLSASGGTTCTDDAPPLIFEGEEIWVA